MAKSRMNSSVFGWIFLSLLLFVRTARSADITGFLVYTSSPGGNEVAQTTAIGFSEIYWESADSGLITTQSGSTSRFNSSTVSQFVYLDPNYWSLMNGNQSYKSFRATVANREVVIPAMRTDITNDNDIHPFLVGSQALDGLMKADTQLSGLLTPIKDNLDKEIAHYQNGEQKINGVWLTKTDNGAQNPPLDAPKTVTLNITTLDGRTYKNAYHITVTPETISFLYDDGGATIDLALLPLDLQKRFNYNPKALEDQKLAEEKAKDEANAAAEDALLAQKKAIAGDITNFERLTFSSPNLTGQVFITTKGDDNVKLGGIHVLLYPKSQIDFIINPKKREAAKQLSFIADQLKTAQQKYQEADAATQNGGVVIENGMYFNAEKRMTELQGQIDTLENSGIFYNSPDYFFTDLPHPLADTKTDADGKFTFAVPAGQYVLIARGSRDILEETEHYWWMVEFEMGNVSRSIQLSNDNLSSSDSDDSLVKTGG